MCTVKERIKNVLIALFLVLWFALCAFGLYYEWANDCVPEDWPSFL